MNNTLSILIDAEKSIKNKDSKSLITFINSLVNEYNKGNLEVNKVTKEKFLTILPYLADSIRGNITDELKLASLNTLFRDN